MSSKRRRRGWRRKSRGLRDQESHGLHHKKKIMKLAKALKVKNKLAGEVTHLKELLVKQNSRSTRQPFDYNNTEVLANLRGKLDELVKVKAAIAVANVEIYGKIFRMAELKGLISTLDALETKQGVICTGGEYGRPVETEYVAQIKQSEADKLVAELQTEIQLIQEVLDEFNFTHTVSV